MDETITEKDLDDLLWVFSTGSKAVSWCSYSVKHSMIYICFYEIKQLNKRTEKKQAHSSFVISSFLP